MGNEASLLQITERGVEAESFLVLGNIRCFVRYKDSEEYEPVDQGSKQCYWSEAKAQ